MPENNHFEYLTCSGETCWAVDKYGYLKTWGQTCEHEASAGAPTLLPRTVDVLKNWKIEKIAPASKEFTFVIANKYDERKGLFLI